MSVETVAMMNVMARDFSEQLKVFLTGFTTSRCQISCLGYVMRALTYLVLGYPARPELTVSRAE